MALCDVILIVIWAVSVTAIIAGTIYTWKLWHLRRENQMLRRLLSDQAALHEMSLNAYITMLREAQWHVGGQ